MSRSLRAAGTADGGETATWRGLLRRFLLAGTGLLLLAACSATTPAPPQAEIPPGPPAAAEPPAAAVHAPAPPSLTGLSADEVVAALGEPDFRRTEPPAELWQYRSGDCVLDVFLYRDPSGEHVVLSQARDRSLVHAGSGRCAAGLEALAARSRESRL